MGRGELIADYLRGRGEGNADISNSQRQTLYLNSSAYDLPQPGDDFTNIESEAESGDADDESDGSGMG